MGFKITDFLLRKAPRWTSSDHIVEFIFLARPAAFGMPLSRMRFAIKHIAEPTLRTDSDHGQPVSPGSFFGHRGRDVSAVIVIYDSASNYPWGRPGTGFIGFRFNTGAGTQYAWARVKMHHGAAVVDYAWADPGESLAAGQTSSSGDQVSALPDLDSLGTLAFGAKGVIAWRQARAKADSAPALPMNPNR
jgi:hypothetical protein